jgi:hypothetical protein
MSDVNRTAPLALWRIAQTFLNTLWMLFGGPERVAFQHTHTDKQRAQFLPWLRAGEALMRRLLLIEASAYPKPNTRPLLRPARKRAQRLLGFEDDKPETWRVRFRCFATSNSSAACGGGGVRSTSDGAPEGCAQSPASSGGAKKRLSRFERDWPTPKPPKFYATRPLAERYEALLRVFNAPAPFAKRLAARLHALAHRARELLRLPIRRRPRKSGEVADTQNLIPDFATLDSAARAVCDSS